MLLIFFCFADCSLVSLMKRELHEELGLHGVQLEMPADELGRIDFFHNLLGMTVFGHPLHF